MSGTTQPNICALEQRMRAGDREATAELLLMHGDRIRRHIWLKLSASTRRLFDSLDVLSSAARQVDRAMVRRSVHFEDVDALIGYVIRSTTSISITKTLIAQRTLHLESSDRVIATQLARAIDGDDDSADGASLRDIADLLPHEDDRFLLWSWLSGRTHAQTAELLGVSAATTRQRWKTIRDRLADHLSSRQESALPKRAASSDRTSATESGGSS